MRHIITWEGEKKVNRILIEKDALVWEESLPVTWQFATQLEAVMGQAVDLRREDNGSITARIVLEDMDKGRQCAELLQRGDIGCSVYVTNLTEKDRRTTGPDRVVTYGRIRQVSLLLPDTIGWSSKPVKSHAASR